MAHHAAAARAIDHIHGLAELLLDLTGSDARDGVGAAARPPGDDQRDRARRILGRAAAAARE